MKKMLKTLRGVMARCLRELAETLEPTILATPEPEEDSRYMRRNPRSVGRARRNWEHIELINETGEQI